MTQVPIAPDLFTWPAEEPALIAGRSSDGKLAFPYRSHRLVNGVREELARVELPASRDAVDLHHAAVPPAGAASREITPIRTVID